VSRLLAAVLCLALSGAAGAADFTFAAFGDTPYSKDGEARFPDFMAEMNREKLAFVVNIGDIKSSWDACTDELYAQRRQWFDLSRHPFIYTPGDNEWTDCRRPVFDKRDPLERLQKLRAVFASGTDSLGQRPIPLERQSKDFPEHARWEHQGMVCITLNAPGPDNHASAKDEHARREKAQREWIAQAFDLARRRGARAVAVFMHGDPWTALGKPRRGYGGLLDTLIANTKAFKGEVLFVHGDTHFYRVDRPLGETVPNFTRVEVFGYPAMNWVRIRVTEKDGRIKFDASPGS
jgi:hypothetical protein